MLYKIKPIDWDYLPTGMAAVSIDDAAIYVGKTGTDHWQVIICKRGETERVYGVRKTERAAKALARKFYLHQAGKFVYEVDRDGRAIKWTRPPL